jgi:cellulose synthase/poly-beta-1,6-N-acetylglucosamine synthase-like glycosyltransferase
MLVSVIIPLYNKEKFVAEAIESLRRQTHAEWEVVVVDDGSTDQGAAVVAALDDPRVRLIRQPNGGVSRARNRGIELARGEVVCFLDADDWYGPYYLETLAALAAQFPAEQYFATGYRRLYPNQAAEWPRPPSPLPSELITNFFDRRRLNGHIVHTNAVAIRRLALQALQPCFPPGESHGEDQDLWFRLAERYPLRYCAWPLVAYRVEVEGSLMTRQPSCEIVPMLVRLEQRALAGKIGGSEREAALRLVADARAKVACHLLEAGRRRDALAELWRARRARSRSWLVACVMALTFSSKMARKWSEWRRMKMPELRADS